MSGRRAQPGTRTETAKNLKSRQVEARSGFHYASDQAAAGVNWPCLASPRSGARACRRRDEAAAICKPDP